MEDWAPIEAISERDIDLLLLEDMHALPSFVEWLIKNAFGDQVILDRFIAANHSIFDPDGESNIILRFRDRSGSFCGLLIENKIAAPPQPDQALRYRKRAETGEREGYWERWKH